MSLITRCPACHTAFKVVPDQLRISEGWVRCGQCDEIFDATANLQAAVSSEQAQPSGPVAAVASTAAEMPADLPVDGAPLQDESVPEPALSVGVAAAEPQPDEAGSEADLALTPEVVSAAGADQDEATPAVEPVEVPSFMREACARGALSPRRRRVYSLAGTFLALILVVQILVHERDRIAASAPAVKPLLESLCGLVHCSLAPLRQIESVQIDSASFTKMRPDTYRLSLTLRNASSMDLALPAVELSLTDTQDQPLLRRVILATELGLSTETLAAGSESSVSLALDVKTEGGAERFTGYRVLAFYP